MQLVQTDDLEFQFPCYARKFTYLLIRAKQKKACFNSHATRGNSPTGYSSDKYGNCVSIPMLRAEIHVKRQIWASVNKVSIPMLRAEIHTFDNALDWFCGVSIPMLRAGIHSDGRTPLLLECGFNSHATRGNSHKAGQIVTLYEVSIPMLRAGIHVTGLRLSCTKTGFNSHATRGNSPLSGSSGIVGELVSIPMLRAGIHPKVRRRKQFKRFQFQCYAQKFTTYKG